MAETVKEERDRLAQENAILRNQLAFAGGRVATPQYTFQLSEGERQELEITGVINKGGRAMTKEDVEAEMAAAGQTGVTIRDAPAETKIPVDANTPGRGPGIRGFDYVYPSVERGKIDPAIAGTPGISGPPADSDPSSSGSDKTDTSSSTPAKK